MDDPVDHALHMLRRHFDGEDGSYVDPDQPRPLTIYRGKVPVADEAGGSGREPTPAPPTFSYMPMPESVVRQAARQPAYNPAERTWSDAGSTEGERLTRALGVEGELPKGETFMSAAPTGWDKYMPQRVPGSYWKRWGEAMDENSEAIREGWKAAKEGNYGAGALGMAGGFLGAGMAPLTALERVLVRDPYLRITGNLKDAQAAEMVADAALTGGVRGMVTPFARAGSLERMATQPWDRVRMPSPGAAGAATAAGAMLAPEDAEASKLSKAMEVARMAIPRELSPLGFYSHGAEAARGLSQAKGSPQQFRSMLEKAGVKGPEMESYLQTFGGRPIVTREEIAQHFMDTMPQITERVSGGSRKKMSDAEFRANYDDLYDKYIVEQGGHPQNDTQLRLWAENWQGSAGSPTRFERYSTPGGEDYREVRLMAPNRQERDFAFEWFDPATQTNSKSTFATREEAQAAAPEGAIVSPREIAERNPVFRSSHWPGDENVVAHYRRKTKIGPNGEKIMLVDELQSDWAQAARDIRNDEVKRVMKERGLSKEEATKVVPSDFGFIKPADPAFEAKLGAAEDAYNEAANSHQELLKQINQSIEKMPDPRTMSPGEYNRAQQAHEAMRQEVLRTHPDFEASVNRVRQTSQDLQGLIDVRRQQEAMQDTGVPMGPYVGNTQQWTDLTLKRILKDAVDNGYDKVAFTQGADQAKRYSLSNQVNSIDYMKEGDDAYRLGIVNKEGDSVDLPQDVFTAKELEQYLGKDVANKIVNDEGKSYRGRNHKSIEGLDLTVGGQGMLGYYDEMVPKRLQLLTKKHDPSVKVGRGYVSNLAPGDSWPYSAQIENEGGQYWVSGRHPDREGITELSPRFGSFREADKARDLLYQGYNQPVHEITITPAMRESILRGQSAHARGGEVMKGEDMRDHFEGGGLTGAALKLVRKAAEKSPAKVGVFPQVAERYPEMVPPVPAIDKKTGKEFLAKTLSPEAIAVQKARIAAQKEINAGNYEPYFPLSERFDVDPSHYPEIQPNTRELVQMKSPKAIAAYEEKARDPQAMENLQAGFEHGLKQKEMAENWYFMGQLEREFINEYGPELGRKMFKEKFPDAMAATTGGADPTSNLMMAHFGNYLHARGEPMPTKAYEYPFPVAGGKYGIQNNMDQYRKMIMEGEGLTYENPKRYNFSANFLGKKTPTIDEQMSGAWDPKMSMPPTGSYGHYEGALSDLAGSMGYDPRYFQEVGWAGIKDMKTPGGFKAQPMIGIVNEAIERTHRITGMPKDEIVRRGLVRSEIPLYGAAGVTAAGSMAPELMREGGEEPSPAAEGRKHGGSVVDRALMLVSRQA
ncbi:MAG: hypothetical protein AMJ59_12690 [Gammaproteobacteria bacterium SG8_31]|nr:MAG: hypothetical protein AMJ59_12690 [Gammaproteobacteria bacterium SG8_31]